MNFGPVTRLYDASRGKHKYFTALTGPRESSLNGGTRIQSAPNASQNVHVKWSGAAHVYTGCKNKGRADVGVSVSRGVVTSSVSMETKQNCRSSFKLSLRVQRSERKRFGRSSGHQLDSLASGAALTRATCAVRKLVGPN